MIIGVPQEIKENEYRVAITPSGVASLKQQGHKIYIGKSAGLYSGFEDADYIESGAEIIDSIEDIYSLSDMVLKVKEPQPSEYKYFKKNLILFNYMHLAVEKTLTQELLDKKVTSIAYETIQTDNGSLPLLVPMSEIAGRMSVQIAANLLENRNNGSGILLSGVAGVSSGKVLIIGAGTVGINAAKIAVGMGADVSIVDINTEKLRNVENIFSSRIKTYLSTETVIAELVKNTDVLICAVLIPGHKAPRVIKEYMVKTMRKGSVIIDVSIDQGGIVETMNRITTHSNPTYERYGVIHYGVSNIPGCVSKTSTLALTNETINYVTEIANNGLIETIKNNTALARGVNTYKGKLTNYGVAEALDFEYTELTSLVGF